MVYYHREEFSLSYKIDPQRLKKYSFEMGPIRPPNEGQDCSLLIRSTRNCPWNRCEFCNTYKGKRFEYRSVEEIKQDINIARVLSTEIKAASWKTGYAGEVNNEVIRAIVRGNPEIYGTGATEPEQLAARLQSLMNVANWLISGARTAFLQDADTLIMRSPELVEVIRYLKESLPSIERVTSYARAKSLARKSPEELRGLHSAGLSRVHVGLESGCDEVLAEMKKGVTAEEHIKGGRKTVESGISLSEYVMPGLGGRRWSEKHAQETARVLNEIDPDFIRLRSLIVRRGSPLYERFLDAYFLPLSEDKVIDEIRLLVENLHCNSTVVSDQMSNLLGEIEGKLPGDKEQMLQTIDRYKAMLPQERLKFRLERRLRSYLAVYGGLEPELKEQVSEAFASLRSETPDAAEKVDSAIEDLKLRFV